MTLELFVSAYTTTSLVMFPILVFIVILLIRDLGKYSKLSEKINNVLKNLSEDIEETGFKKEKQESALSHISRFINK
jgi:uncharacterized protein YoxC